MAKYDIPFDNTPNYMNMMKESSGPQPNVAYQKLFEGIGQSADNTITGIDTINKQDIDKKVRDQVETAQSAYDMSDKNAAALGQTDIGARQKIGTGANSATGVGDGGTTDNPGEPDTTGFDDTGPSIYSEKGQPAAADTLNPEPFAVGGVLQQSGDNAPPEINRDVNTIKRMSAAREAGELTPIYFSTWLNNRMKTLKSQYPGYKDYIDQKVHEISGIKPANEQIRDAWQIFNRQDSAAGKQDNWARSQGSNQANVAAVNATADEADLAGDKTKAQWLRGLAIQAMQGDAIAAQQMVLIHGRRSGAALSWKETTEQAGALNAGRQQTSRTVADNYISAIPSLQSVARVNADVTVASHNKQFGTGYKGYDDFIQQMAVKVTSGGTATEQDEALTANLVSELARARDKGFQTALESKMPDGRTLGATMDAPDKLRFKEEWDRNANRTIAALSGDKKDYSTAGMVATLTTQDAANRKRRVDGMQGSALRDYDALSPGAQERYKDITGFSGRLKQLGEDTPFYKQFFPAIGSGRVTNPKDAEQQMRLDKGELSKQDHKDLITGAAVILAKPGDLSPVEIGNYAKYVRSPEMFSQLAKVTKKSDQMSLMATLNSEQVLTTLKQSMSPDEFTAHTKGMDRNIALLMAQRSDDMQGDKNTYPDRVSFDPKTAHWVWNPLVLDEKQKLQPGGGASQAADNAKVNAWMQDKVAAYNAGIDALGRLHGLQGDKLGAYMTAFMHERGLDDRAQPGIVDTLFKAISKTFTPDTEMPGQFKVAPAAPVKTPLVEPAPAAAPGKRSDAGGTPAVQQASLTAPAAPVAPAIAPAATTPPAEYDAKVNDRSIKAYVKQSTVPIDKFLAPDKKAAYSIAGMNPEFKGRLEKMFNAMPEDMRAGTNIFSGFRDNEHQARLYERAVAKYGSEEAARHWVAPPGHSPHNMGIAADLKFGSKAAQQWFHENAAKHGLNFRMGHEGWHIEPIEGRRLAAK